MLESAGHQYDVGDRVASLDLVNVRGLTAGVLDALFSVGLNA
jgi:hypothetical protein